MGVHVRGKRLYEAFYLPAAVNEANLHLDGDFLNALECFLKVQSNAN